MSEICDSSQIQDNLFDSIQNRKERANLMKRIDSLNQRFGLKTVQLAVDGEKLQLWKVKCKHCSDNYLTEINEILAI